MVRPITKKQIGRIKALQSRVGLSDDQYRTVLSGYMAANREPATSCTQLTVTQANHLASVLEGLLKRTPGTVTAMRFDHLAGRSRYWPSPAQLRKIHVLWSQVSRADPEQRDAALNQFLHNRFKRSSIDMVEAKLVPKVVATLEAMLTQQTNNEVIDG